MKAINLRTEYLNNPIGIGIRKPRFFWNCVDGVKQTAYRIVCCCDEETIWDSGCIESSSMTHVRYAGRELKSRDKILWSVQLWDENKVPGEAVESCFEIGLLDKSDWQAKWITGDYRPKKNARYPVDCFKKEFRAERKIAKARLYATGRGIYDVTINKTRLENFIFAPGMTDYRKRIQYQTYDVTALISDSNTIELRLADGWYRGSSSAYGVTCVYGNQTSLAAQLLITYKDGSSQTVITDETWNWSNDGQLRFADLKDGEIYDANMHPTYCSKAKEVTAPKALITASNNVLVTEHERFTPLRLKNNVLDFGQNISGYLEFRIRGKRGQKISIVCGETLDASGNVDLSGIQETKPENGWTKTKVIKKLLTNTFKGNTVGTPLQKIDFICSEKEDSYKTSFAIFGFRYAQIDSDAEIEATSIAVYSDMEQTGEFSCSDERINKLVENTRWSMKGNFLDIPTDCPTRERLGWTGDAQIFFNTGAYLMNIAPFFSKWLKDMEDAQYKNGLLPAVLPYEGVEIMYKPTGSSVGWVDAVYLIPWRFYLAYHDKAILEQHWPMMKKYADYLKANLKKDGSFHKGIQLGEWLEPVEFRDGGNKDIHPEECTAYAHLAFDTMSSIADIIGEKDTAEGLASLAEKTAKAYWVFAEPDTDRQSKLVRPLALGLLSKDEKKKTQQRLKKAVENFGYRVGTGFLSTPFVLPVLTEAGESETAYKMLLNPEKPGWLYEVEHGATTIWETWEGDVSLNHYSPGAVCEWIFKTVGGIRVKGENRFEIRPVPGGMISFASVKYMSIYGEIKNSWKKTETGYAYKISIPANTTAEIMIPGRNAIKVSAGSLEIEV